MMIKYLKFHLLNAQRLLSPECNFTHCTTQNVLCINTIYHSYMIKPGSMLTYSFNDYAAYDERKHIFPVNRVNSMNHYSDVIIGAMASQITSLTIVYSTVYSGADQRKHRSSASLAFVRGIHQHKWPETRKMFPFDDVITILPNRLNISMAFTDQ